MQSNELIELIILVGYPPTNEIRKKKRKETTEILSYNRYQLVK